MKKVNVIRHLAFEDLDGFEQVFADAGLPVQYYEAGVDDLSVLGVDDDLLVVLGGPISANQVDEFPFLQTEIDLLKARVSQDKPVLGICLGAQLIARAAGAAVYPGNKEIGWSSLQITDAGKDSPLAAIEQSACMVLHWHGETFDLPKGARLLASTDANLNQAFSLGNRVMGLQFHMEVSEAGLQRWYIGHIAEIENTNGVSVDLLRQQAADFAAPAANSGRDFLKLWLRSLT